MCFYRPWFNFGWKHLFLLIKWKPKRSLWLKAEASLKHNTSGYCPPDKAQFFQKNILLEDFE